ncbi:MAG: DUF3147 family protein [Novosphingobium sp.]
MVAKALLSGALIAAISEIGKRLPVLAALVTALPLVSIIAMILLWREQPGGETIARFSQATFWLVLPSLPMYLLIAVLLRHGQPFWPSLAFGCALTAALYLIMLWQGPRLGLSL